MSDVFIGAGKATGMFYVGPKSATLPAYPGEALSADFKLVGAISEDGISLSLPNGDVVRNWALIPERKINTENGTVTAPILYTNKTVLETLFGTANVTHTAASATHGNVDSVTLAPDVSAESASYVFLMKDGDKLAALMSDDALITEISDVNFSASESAVWEVTLDGVWTFMIDDGAATS